MLTSLTLDNAAGSPIVLHEVSGTAKRALISAKGLVGVGALRQSKRVRPSAHGGINETRFEDGGTITLEGEIVGATYAEAEEQFSAVSQVMLETLDSGPALMKYETSGGRKLQLRVKLDSDIEPVLSGVAPRYVYQCSFFAEDPRSYTQAATTLTGAGITGTAIEATFLKASATTRPWDVKVDAGHIYWVDRSTKAIGRATIAGATIEPEWVKTSGIPASLAIDAGHIYWGLNDPLNGVIGRAAIGGGTIENEWIKTGVGGPIFGVAVNASNVFYVYGQHIGRAEIGGLSNETQWMSPATQPLCVTVDASFIYFGNGTDTTQGGVPGGSIARATIAGAAIQTSWIPGTGKVVGVTVNASNIFWLSASHNVGRAKLNGSEAFYAFIPGLNAEPSGLTANTEHLYWGESTGYISRSKELANGGPVGSACKVEQTGNRPSPLVFKINGLVANPAIVRKSDGARLALTGTITAGNYAEIDTAKRTVLLNGTANLLSSLDAQNTNWGAFEAPNSPAAETYELAASSATTAKIETTYRSSYA